MKILLDLNVVLDVILRRQPWLGDAMAVWNAHHSGKFEGMLAATEITNLFYIVRRLESEAAARTAVHACLMTFDCVPIDRSLLIAADTQVGSDFEDNVCVASAVAAGADFIVTRDATGFAHSPVSVVSPSELLRRLTASSP